MSEKDSAKDVTEQEDLSGKRPAEPSVRVGRVRGVRVRDLHAATEQAPDTGLANTPNRDCRSQDHPPPASQELAPPKKLPDSSDSPVEATPEEPLSTEQPEEPPVQPISRRVKRHPLRMLPNCKITGIYYQASLAEALAGFAPHEITSIVLDEATNADFPLDWNADKCEISCHPEKAGEFEIVLCVDVLRRERHVFPFKLTVNPDPKTLWKNIPSNPSGIYAKPDSDKTFLPCGERLCIVAASQRGRSHAQEGKPRDDDFLADYSAETNCITLIVADGAGSARFAREGSRLATRTALEKVKASTTAEFWTAVTPAIVKWANEKDAKAEQSIQAALYKVLVHAAWEAKTRIKEEAQSHEARYLADYKKAEKFASRDYATTLILTIVKRLDPRQWFIATFWVGDGGMGIYRPSAGEVRVLGTPDGGEYGGQTRFLTEDSAEVWPQDANKLIARRLRFDVVDSFEAVVLMTDGVSDPKFETDNNLVSFAKWNDLWADLTKAVPFKNRDESVADALLDWMDFWSAGNHDDRTMVVLY